MKKKAVLMMMMMAGLLLAGCGEQKPKAEVNDAISDPVVITSSEVIEVDPTEKTYIVKGSDITANGGYATYNVADKFIWELPGGDYELNIIPEFHPTVNVEGEYYILFDGASIKGDLDGVRLWFKCANAKKEIYIYSKSLSSNSISRTPLLETDDNGFVSLRGTADGFRNNSIIVTPDPEYRGMLIDPTMYDLETGLEIQHE